MGMELLPPERMKYSRIVHLLFERINLISRYSFRGGGGRGRKSRVHPCVSRPGAESIAGTGFLILCPRVLLHEVHKAVKMQPA